MHKLNSLRSKKHPLHGPSLTTLLFLLIILTAAFISSLWVSTLSTTNIKPTTNTIANQTLVPPNVSSNYDKTIETIKQSKKFQPTVLNCSSGNQTCSSNYPTTTLETEKNSAVCPEYFRWIHEDLKPWKEKGISREMVEMAKKTAHFRLVVKNGKGYLEKYQESIQTRDVFTVWGILQLLRKYPGKVPDLEIMFDCNDKPVVPMGLYDGPNVIGPPPVFGYCVDRWSQDIVFPDWSFWGWAEINIRPWENLLKDIKKGNEKIKWNDREPYAYWKGNPFTALTRLDLLKCNASTTHDWNVRLFSQDWIKESEQGFNHSNLADQCTYRYKIYIEGYGWSVSEKYILACDSPTLLVKPRYYDFFTRSLQPLQHYWPIKENDKCKSIKHAVDWGNNHQQKVQEIGKAGSKFIHEELSMDYVYDYMFHLLNEYAKLLKFESRVPEGAVELCPETMACSRSRWSEKEFMSESMVREPSTKAPCSLPPPFEPSSLRIFYATKQNLINRVERWENEYWKNNQ
ncbi:O-glucosyltransferase rumi homolog isoform X2 [Trifolium pratense]|uniref:O-glucosyltransferase rumi homolog isoform X2 n=1 Tax=Trifolium pratense TaxID=57577 RepID=UPI001E697E5F|nr:O-glucosyltransferase rumi homolog isoform X2 [Trifolium pratense]